MIYNAFTHNTDQPATRRTQTVIISTQQQALKPGSDFTSTWIFH